MALGIGANTAIYSFLDSLLLSSLPVSDPEVAGRHQLACEDGTGGEIRHAQHERAYLIDDPELGRVSPIFPYPRFRASPGRCAFSDVFAYCHTREVRSIMSPSRRSRGRAAANWSPEIFFAASAWRRRQDG